MTSESAPATRDDAGDHRVPRMAPRARERFYAGSGQPAPAPQDEEIAAVIRRELAWVVGNDTFDKPMVRQALLATAQAVRQLFPTNPGDQT